tara:strand:+ start:35538 stop:36146 length:609 start_codon:yes stop_codon:yes gene_type:complete
MQNDIFSLCQWIEIDSKQSEKYDVAFYFEQADLDPQGVDLFGELPKIYLHKGDLKLDKSFSMYAQGFGVFILDGSLEVDGTFGFYTADAYTVLIITGEIRVKNMAIGWDSQLGVGRSLIADQILWVSLSHAGFLVIKETIKAKTIRLHKETCVSLGFPPVGNILEFPLQFNKEFSSRYQIAPGEQPDIKIIIQALDEGVRLF